MLALAEQRQQTRHDMRETSLEKMPSGGHVTDAAASPDARAGPCDDLVRALVRRVGPCWRARVGLHRPLQTDRIETALLVAVPVLLGSLARLPMGMLTDRFGGRARLHGAARLLVARRLHRSADQQLRLAARARRS